MVKRCIIVILIVILCCFCPTSVFATYESKSLRVAFCPLDGFFEYDENGEECGYGVDFLNQISVQSGIHFKYVYVEKWEDCKEMLRNGEIDIWMPVSGTKKDESEFTYSSESIIYTFRAIMTLDDREDLYYNDFETLSTIKIAVTTTFLNNPLTMTYFEGLDISPELVEFDSYNQCKTALMEGEVDALISNIMDYEDGMKILARFNPIDNYIVMAPDNPYRVKINDAICDIKLDNPFYATSLYQKYYPERNITPFTKEEKKFIEEDRVLKVGLHVENRPMAYQNADTGEYVGVLIDILHLLEEKTGLCFEIVPVGNEYELQECIQKGKVDFVIPGIRCEESQGVQDIFSTKDIFSSNIVFAALHGAVIDPQKKLIVGIPKGHEDIYTAIRASKRDIVVKEYMDEDACVKAHKNGEIEAIVQNSFTMGYLLQDPHYEHIRVIPSLSISTNYCITGNEKIESSVLSILNKGIEQIETSEVDKIINQHTMLERFDATFWDRMYENRSVYIRILLLISVAGIAILIYIRVKSRFYHTLEQKNMELKKANDAKGEFLSSVSHDMRTPMNAIIGLSELALEEKGNENLMVDYMQKINSSGKYLLELINDVLDMSKIESNKITLNIEVICIAELFEEIAVIITPQIQEKNINYTFDASGFKEKYAMIDKVRVKQIFVNLISNAVKFTQTGGTIECIVTNVMDKDNQLRDRIIVRDNGIGMNEEFLPKVFLPFEQEAQSNKYNYGGTGLGLSIVRAIVELMGGEISVKSKKNEGTEFIIEFEHHGVHKMAEQGSKNVRTMEVDLTGKRILLCEDHPLNTQIAVRLLEKKGIFVTCVSNGQNAVEVFAKSEYYYFDAILMDIRMPVMNGLEATRVIRSLEREDAKKIPIIALTANAFDEDKNQTSVAGMNAHLAKPIEPQVLYQTLYECCNFPLQVSNKML